ncbi:hypothetical protein D3Z58_22790 [Clostridiaceae bacterium]|nr:hypothetical protein [Clostridiaceae bacterium]
MKKNIFIVVSSFISCIAGAGITAKMYSTKTAKLEDNFQKMYEFYKILNKWLTLKQEGKSLKDYFLKNGYKSVAIYGMKELGERLYDELKDTEIEVKYMIDKNADNLYSEVTIVTPDGELEEVDVIVVTAVHYYEEIENMLKNKIDYPILSMEDIVYEMS